MASEELRACGVTCFNAGKIRKLQVLLPPSEEVSVEAARHKAVGHPVRLTILRILAVEPCCVCDLANILDQPVSTISQHLRNLKHAGLLQSQQEGKLVIYSLTPIAVAMQAKPQTSART